MAYGHTSLFLLTFALPFSKANAHHLLLFTFKFVFTYLLTPWSRVLLEKQVCFYIEINIKKVKVTLEQATKAQKEGRVIALLFL
jgi:hypothetical protein